MLVKHGYTLRLIISLFFVQTINQRVEIGQKRMAFTAVYVLLHILTDIKVMWRCKGK